MTTPQQIGKYRILDEIASGAQGAVYRAFDPSTSATVAVKVLHQQHSGNASFVERFRREAALIQSIDHENVIKILDFGNSDGRQFMAMEFIPETLSNLIEVTGAFPLDRAVALSVGIAEGIGQAHAQGIVHRDIKPQNVLLTTDGIPKLTDFGIARGEMLNTMTATGVMMGTPFYMSPEQANGERGDARSDVYSLGCLVYQLLSGEVPFSGDTPLAILRRHVEDLPVPLKTRLPGIPPAVSRCVEQAMAKDPERRFANGNAFSTALRSTLPSAGPDSPGHIDEDPVISAPIESGPSSTESPGQDEPDGEIGDESIPDMEPDSEVEEKAPEENSVAASAASSGMGGDPPRSSGGPTDSPLSDKSSGRNIPPFIWVALGLLVVVFFAFQFSNSQKPERSVSSRYSVSSPFGDGTGSDGPQLTPQPDSRLEGRVVVRATVAPTATSIPTRDPAWGAGGVSHGIPAPPNPDAPLTNPLIPIPTWDPGVVETSSAPPTPASVAKPAATVAQPSAAKATTAPTAVRRRPSGSITRAFRTLESVYGIGYVGPYRGSATNQIGGIEEALFNFEDGDPMHPFLADKWDIDPQGTRASITLKAGLKWQSPTGYEDEDFGELNAAELVEWFNRSNATTNPESTYGDAGDFAALFLEAKAVDDLTVEVALVAPFYYCLPLTQFGCLSAARGVHKVTSADTHGIDWARHHHIGTGPYVQGDDCRAGDRCTMHAVDSHWRTIGNVATITGIQVPEATTQIAMLINGSIDMTELDYKLLPDVIADGFTFLETMPGGYIGQSILFPGNLWEHSHARTAEALAPWDGPTLAEDYPWIGNPWGDQGNTCTDGDAPGHDLCGNAPYTDDNNPEGMDDMEQARLVRLALSTAIDRGAIVSSLLNDLGTPIYSEYMGPEYPGWDAARETGCFDWVGGDIVCSRTVQSVPWKIADGDLGLAAHLLTTAGYPLVDGVRQGFGELVLQAYVAEAGPVSLEVADTIMSDWTRLGIEISGLVEDYGGVISPRMRQRIQYLPVLKNGDIHSNVYPIDWPLPVTDTSSTRPGWGVGFESQPGAKWFFEILGERDASVRAEKHLNWVDYSMFWLQYAGVFQVPKGIVVNSRIKSWNGYQQHYSNVSGNPEFIVLND